MHLGRLHTRSELLSVLCSWQCVALWLRMQSYLRCTTPAPPLAAASLCKP